MNNKAAFTALTALFLLILEGCNGEATSGDNTTADTMAPREATDPVPEPPTLPDTADSDSRVSPGSGEQQEVLYQVRGTEPFWSLKIGRPYSTYRSMEGDSLGFAYREPESAAGRQEEWVQLFPLGKEHWVLLRRGRTPCSDGMSDREYTYTATLWLNGKLLDGCAEKE